jgi:hypothetical protein
MESTSMTPEEEDRLARVISQGGTVDSDEAVINGVNGR